MAETPGPLDPPASLRRVHSALPQLPSTPCLDSTPPASSHPQRPANASQRDSGLAIVSAPCAHSQPRHALCPKYPVVPASVRARASDSAHRNIPAIPRGLWPAALPASHHADDPPRRTRSYPTGRSVVVSPPAPRSPRLQFLALSQSE